MSKLKSNENEQPAFVSPAFLILPEEKVIFKTNPHWLAIVVPEIALAILGALIIEYLPSFWPEPIPYQRWILVFFGAGQCYIPLAFLLCTRSLLDTSR